MDLQTHHLLTARERDCRRLVARERDSGAIARELSLGTGTVDDYIETARAKLGGITRFAAARALRAYEETEAAPAAPVPRQDPLSKDDDPPDMFPHSSRADLPSAVGGHGRMREERAVSDFALPEQFASGREGRDTLSSPERLVMTAARFTPLAIGSFAALAIPLLLQFLPTFHQR